MRGINGLTRDGIDLRTFAAQLADAAYPITLRHGLADSWLELQDDLSDALAETVKKWGSESPQPSSSGASEAWREGFLADLTDEAYRVVLMRGMTGSFLEAELGLFDAFRSVMDALNWKRSRMARA
jgi:hypothetical protein